LTPEVNSISEYRAIRSAAAESNWSVLCRKGRKECANVAAQFPPRGAGLRQKGDPANEHDRGAEAYALQQRLQKFGAAAYAKGNIAAAGGGGKEL